MDYSLTTFILTTLVFFSVAAKAALLRRAGVRAVRFGERDKKDNILIPCMLFFYYMAAAEAFGLPVAGRRLFYRYFVHWYGSALCFAGLIFITAALVTLGQSFRIGIDDVKPGALITSGPFAINRNPIYTGFLMVFAGVFITYANWVFIIYFAAGALIINRQIVREEESLKKAYGSEYIDYCKRVRRYF